MPLEMKYFVLKPAGTSIYAEASRLALEVYAQHIKNIDPILAKQLEIWSANETAKAFRDLSPEISQSEKD